MAKLIAFVPTILLIAGCSDERGAGGDVDAPAIGLEEYCSLLADTYAERGARCNGGEPAEYRRSYERTRAFCLARQALIDAGQGKFDAEVAYRCTREIQSFVCNPDRDHPAICDEIVAGTVAVGGACSFHGSCAAGTTCRFGRGDCIGTCAEPKSPGERCDRTLPANAIATRTATAPVFALFGAGTLLVATTFIAPTPGLRGS